MPVDSRDKRAGAGGRHTAPAYPLPDGTIDAEDRAMAAGVYPLPLESVEVYNIETAIVYILGEDVGVSAIVGTKIYPMVVPQNAVMPAITYQKISGQWQIQMDGPHNMSEERFQINCWASTYGGAKALCEAVRDVLNGYDSAVNVVDFHVMTLENEMDLLVEIPDERGARRYARAMDFNVWYRITS